MKNKTIFYLQMRSFHKTSGWEHFIGTLFHHLASVDMSVRIVCYKERHNPKENSTLCESDKIKTKILNRRYQSSFILRYLYECWLVIRAGFMPKFWRESDYVLVHSFPSSFLCIWFAKVIYRKKVTELSLDIACKL